MFFNGEKHSYPSEDTLTYLKVPTVKVSTRPDEQSYGLRLVLESTQRGLRRLALIAPHLHCRGAKHWPSFRPVPPPRSQSAPSSSFEPPKRLTDIQEYAHLF